MNISSSLEMLFRENYWFYHSLYKGVGCCIHKKYLLDWFACVAFVETSYIVCLSLNHCNEKKVEFSRFSQESLQQIYSFQL